MTQKQGAWLAAGVAALAFLPSLGFGFVYLDDYLMVQKWEYYSRLGSAWSAVSNPVWAVGTVPVDYYRPLSALVYVLGAWLSQAVLSGPSPFFFHVTNWALQIWIAWMLHRVLTRLGQPPTRALALCALFTLAPALAGAVAWIGGQNELLLAAFSLAAFLAYLERRLAAHAVWFLLALLSKENAAVLPVVCGLHFAALGLPGLTRSPATWRRLAGAWLAPIGVFALLRHGVLSAHTGGESASSLASVLGSMLTGLRFVPIYLGRLLLPFGLSTLPTAQDASLAVQAAGGIAATALIALVWLHKGEARRLSVLGAFWFLAFLLPTFVRATDDLSFVLREDRAYLASVGLLFPLLPLADRVSGRVFVAVLLALACFQLPHQLDYSDGERFYRVATERSPSLAFARAHLGDMHLFAGEPDRAIDEYARAIALNPTEPHVHNNLAVALERRGRWPEAEAEYRRELAFYPGDTLSLYGLAALLAAQNRSVEAKSLLERCLRVDPAHADALRLARELSGS